MSKTGRNKHEWGVIGQARNPYREFHYCPLCSRYSERGDKPYMTLKQFKGLVVAMSKTSNPVYDADSDTLYLDGRGSHWAEGSKEYASWASSCLHCGGTMRVKRPGNHYCRRCREAQRLTSGRGYPY